MYAEKNAISNALGYAKFYGINAPMAKAITANVRRSRRKIFIDSFGYLNFGSRASLAVAATLLESSACV